MDIDTDKGYYENMTRLLKQNPPDRSNSVSVSSNDSMYSNSLCSVTEVKDATRLSRTNTFTAESSRQTAIEHLSSAAHWGLGALTSGFGAVFLATAFVNFCKYMYAKFHSEKSDKDAFVDKLQDRSDAVRYPSSLRDEEIDDEWVPDTEPIKQDDAALQDNTAWLESQVNNFHKYMGRENIKQLTLEDEKRHRKS